MHMVGMQLAVHCWCRYILHTEAGQPDSELACCSNTSLCMISVMAELKCCTCRYTACNLSCDLLGCSRI